MDKANILQANSDFQEALVTGDLIALQAILLKSDDTFYATVSYS